MVEQLSDNGRIFIDTPNFDVFCHIHLFYYTLPFYEKLVDRFNMKIIDYKEFKEPIAQCDSIWVIFAKNSDKAPKVKIPYTSKQMIDKRKVSWANDLIEYYNNLKIIKNILNNNNNIYWWGTGAFSISYLYSIYKLKLVKKCNIIPIDKIIKREGYIMPACSHPVKLACTIHNTSVDAVIIATNLVDEVMKYMQYNNITYDNTVCIKGFE